MLCVALYKKQVESASDIPKVTNWMAVILHPLLEG
jgi:hypothetical protein